MNHNESELTLSIGFEEGFLTEKDESAVLLAKKDTPVPKSMIERTATCNDLADSSHGNPRTGRK